MNNGISNHTAYVVVTNSSSHTKHDVVVYRAPNTYVRVVIVVTAAAGPRQSTRYDSPVRSNTSVRSDRAASGEGGVTRAGGGGRGEGVK